MNTPRNILFVCMGNICRSPAAEAIFRQKVADANLGDQFHIDSAGTTAFHQGNPADSRMRKAGRARGYDLDSLSRPVRVEDFGKFDMLIAMDHENQRDLLALAPDNDARAKIHLMCDFATQHDDFEEVPDPYYGGGKGFEVVMDLLEDACGGLLAHLQTRQ